MSFLNVHLLVMLLSANSLLALRPSEAHPPRLHVPGHWGNDTKGDEVHWLPGEPAPTNDVVFSWCRKGAVGCHRAALKHGRCYDLSMLDGPMRAYLNTVGAQDGRCMLFQNYDCSGEHTAMFTGRSHWTKTICANDKNSRVEWNRQASAVRCCAGGPERRWCNYGIEKADRCTEG
ncbi:hypothetical protein A9Z42_0091170 [Trichoderma parareesei]|uniref:SSCRP protein n=1 Tax=Trichoderma parareesei TaxID=858221 RepID=A0A2H3A6B8_TRIPA|nr:hypothetical protein A9Z42_0091170 [Trichoderma parareesei]